MSKLYYTDPLVAAYMAGNFGVRYDDTLWGGKGGTYGAELYNFFYQYKSRILPCDYGGDKHFIFSDSHHIFEPQNGDLIIDLGNNNPYWIDDDGCAWWDNECYSGVFKDYEIIQRNNKAFFMPEREDD